MKMPEGLFFFDKDGTKRTEIRIKWWENPLAMTYKSISIEPIDNLPEKPIELSELKEDSCCLGACISNILGFLNINFLKLKK